VDLPPLAIEAVVRAAEQGKALTATAGYVTPSAMIIREAMLRACVVLGARATCTLIAEALNPVSVWRSLLMVCHGSLLRACALETPPGLGLRQQWPGG
jgi:hypothetical protein